MKFKSKITHYDNVIQIRIDVPFNVRYVFVYLYKIQEYFILFDAGLDMGNWVDIFFDCLKNLDVNPQHIKYCFISHNHLDHIGLIEGLRQKNPPIKILMHDITNQKLRWESNPKNAEELKKETEETVNLMLQYGLSKNEGTLLTNYFLKWPRMKTYSKPDVILHDGDEITIDGTNTKLKVIWTPGHSLGHICLFDTKRRYLFSGDHILSRITPHIGIFIVNKIIKEQYSEYNFTNILDLYLNSLERIKRLAPKIIFPAHQEIIRDPLKRIEEIQAHHAHRLSEISDLIKDNPKTPYEISKAHFGADLDEINSFLALSEVLAHLRYLLDKGQVKSQKKYGKIHFYS